VGGFKGKRYEWLFANRSYRYGKNLGRVIEPCGAFSDVEHLCAGIVKDLQLATPNACLLVYYPRGTSGLNCHKDDEPAHASEQVITLCHGVGANLVLQNNRRQEVAREWLEGGDFYVFRDQRSFYHGVDGVESAGSGRWAFTFCVFKQSSGTVN
jgi:alkylated DNA repair dioxygenase AlkB